MKTNKIWYICFIIGTALGLILSASGYFLNYQCSSKSNFCTLSQINQKIIYFPTVYVFLSNAITFVNDNWLITSMFFIIPILQYSMIGSITGIVLMKANEKRKK